MNDSILSEVRKAREQYASYFKYDLDRIYADLKIRQDQHISEGWMVVSPPAYPMKNSDLTLQHARFKR